MLNVANCEFNENILIQTTLILGDNFSSSILKQFDHITITIIFKIFCYK